MHTPHDPQRRRFLKTLGIGTAAVGTGATLGQIPLTQADAISQAPRRPDTPDQYHETAHIRAYYATLRD